MHATGELHLCVANAFSSLEALSCSLLGANGQQCAMVSNPPCKPGIDVAVLVIALSVYVCSTTARQIQS